MNDTPRFFAIEQYDEATFDRSQLHFGDILMTIVPRVQFESGYLKFYQSGNDWTWQNRPFRSQSMFLIPLAVSQHFDKSAFARLSIEADAAAPSEYKGFFRVPITLGVEVALDDADLLAYCDMDYSRFCSHVVFFYDCGQLTSIELVSQGARKETHGLVPSMMHTAPIFRGSLVPFLMRNCQRPQTYSFDFRLNRAQINQDAARNATSREEYEENSRRLGEQCERIDYEKMKEIETQCNLVTSSILYCCVITNDCPSGGAKLTAIVCFEKDEQRLQDFEQHFRDTQCWSPREFQYTIEERAVLHRIYNVLQDNAYLKSIYYDVPTLDWE
jgi:hypothetical protein